MQKSSFILVLFAFTALSFVSAVPTVTDKVTVHKRDSQSVTQRIRFKTAWGLTDAASNTVTQPFLRVWCSKDDGNDFVGTQYSLVPAESKGRTFGTLVQDLDYDIVICSDLNKAELWLRQSGGTLAAGQSTDTPCMTKDSGGYLPGFKEFLNPFGTYLVPDCSGSV